MTTRPQGRLGKAVLLTMTALTAMVTLFGLSVAPASAANHSGTGCQSVSGNLFACFYTDNNLTPTANVLNIDQTNADWVIYKNSPGVCQSDWNDCASSAFNHLSGNIYVWRDINCQNGELTLASGQRINQLGPDGFGDVITADKIGSVAAGC